MEQKYILSGFTSQHEAIERHRELILESGISESELATVHSTQFILSLEEWGLEIDEGLRILLKDDEKNNRLIKIPIHQIFVNSYIPMVFRYSEKKWVDNFFKDGSIRISSFKKFHKHTDEQRGDKDEGYNIISGVKDKIYMYAITQHGSDAFVLSTSLLLDPKLYTDFDVDDCFIIEKPYEFMQAIASHIPNLKGVNFGPCLYQPQHFIRRSIEMNLEALNSEYNPDDLGNIIQLVNDAGGLDPLFIKTINYSNQHEYRFLWHSSNENLPEHLDLKVPEAVNFCRRVRPEDLE